MIPAALRRTAVFGTVAGLGFTLAWMLGAAEGRPGKGKPRIPVVPLPPGTSLQSPGGVGGISLVRAEKLVVGPVQDVVLDDGTRLPFRSKVLRGDAERPLPSPGEEVSRVLITNPDLQLLPVPRTRAEYDASSDAEPTRIRAPEGTLDTGPHEAMVIHFRGGVKARSVREGTPWDFEGEEAISDVQARTLKSAGAVSLVSRDLHVEGRDLDASEIARTVLLSGGAKGTVESARGVRIAGGRAEGTTRFRCRGAFRILPLPVPAGAAAKVERWRLVLDEDAAVDQDDGSLAARHIEADLTRPVAGAGGETTVDEVRADGAVVLTGKGEGRDFRATGEKLLARPEARGTTNAWLDGSPAVFVREADGGREVRTLEVRGDGTARLGFPAGEGPVEAIFRGGARAVLLEPAEKAGDAPRRRDLRAATLAITGMRTGGGPTRVESVVAEGQAVLQDGDRSAQARRIDFHPIEGGGSRTVLDGDVLLSWPAAGALDPVSALSPAGDGTGGGPPVPAEPGTMLLSSPGKVVVEQPADGDRENGTRFTVEGGAVLRRVAGEREIYRLTCASIDAKTPPGARGLDRLRAQGDVRLAGREENEAGRRYDLRGDLLEVVGAPGSTKARTADVTGSAERPAYASFLREDGKPITVTARTLRFDRSTNGFRAEDGVRGTGILPENAAAGGRSGPTGAAELACGVLTGVLAQGKTGGSSRVVSLDASDAVWIRTATEYVSGDRLHYEDARGTILLRGDPARVTARTQGAPADLKLEDVCEAPELALVLADGKLLEASAASGGRVVHHRVSPAAAGKPAPVPERIESRCKGLLAYRPAETRLRDGVTMVLSRMAGGAFVPLYRMEGADTVTIQHPLVDGKVGGAVRATAESAGGRISLGFESGEFKATEVSRADVDGVTHWITLQSSPGMPRIRIEKGDATGTCRHAVYDPDGNRLVETSAMILESGK